MNVEGSKETSDLLALPFKFDWNGFQRYPSMIY